MMEPTIITVFGSVILACLTYYFTKKQSTATHWREQKLNHYKVLLSSLSGIVDDAGDKQTSRNNLALAVNTIVLVAPQYVITALMEFMENADYINFPERHDELLRSLLLLIRKDIGLTKGDDGNSFYFHFFAPNHALKK